MNRLASVIVVLAGFVLLGEKTALADTINVPTTFAPASSDGDNRFTPSPYLAITTGGGITCIGPASPFGGERV